MLSITAEGAEGVLVCTVHTNTGPVVFDGSSVNDRTAFFSTIVVSSQRPWRAAGHTRSTSAAG